MAEQLLVAIARALFILAVSLVTLSCASRPFEHDTIDSVPFTDRATTKVDDDVRVSVAVPSADETRQIFGVPLYDRGIQPVWIKVENHSEFRIRYAPVGTDSNYFSPLEVAYVHRSGFSDSARQDMERYLHDSAMPRFIPPGSTQSGFVFTHLRKGTKDVTVDLFGNRIDSNFTFFVEVPGLEPDHADLDLDRIYRPNEIDDLDQDGFAERIRAMDCCARDLAGENSGNPVNVVFVGSGTNLLTALLRADWSETLRPRDDSERQRRDKGQALFGRTADAVFRRTRGGEGDRNELRLWLAPLTFDGARVWMGQVTHHMAHGSRVMLDPDVDDPRNHLLQSAWYAQSLAKFAWLEGPESIPIEQPRQGLEGMEFFTDGFRIVLWLSEEPISMLEVQRPRLDEPPRSR